MQSPCNLFHWHNCSPSIIERIRSKNDGTELYRFAKLHWLITDHNITDVARSFFWSIFIRNSVSATVQSLVYYKTSWQNKKQDETKCWLLDQSLHNYFEVKACYFWQSINKTQTHLLLLCKENLFLIVKFVWLDHIKQISKFNSLDQFGYNYRKKFTLYLTIENKDDKIINEVRTCGIVTIF